MCKRRALVNKEALLAVKNCRKTESVWPGAAGNGSVAAEHR